MTKKHTHQKMIGPEAPSKSTVLNLILMGPVVYCNARTSVNESTAMNDPRIDDKRAGALQRERLTPVHAASPMPSMIIQQAVGVGKARRAHRSSRDRRTGSSDGWSAIP